MFDINTAMFIQNMWMDGFGNRITDNEYNQLLSASTWNENEEDIRADLNFYPEDMTFEEYVMGIKL